MREPKGDIKLPTQKSEEPIILSVYLTPMRDMNNIYCFDFIIHQIQNSIFSNAYPISRFSSNFYHSYENIECGTLLNFSGGFAYKQVK